MAAFSIVKLILNTVGLVYWRISCDSSNISKTSFQRKIYSGGIKEGWLKL